MKPVICTINSEPILVTDIKRVGSYLYSGVGDGIDNYELFTSASTGTTSRRNAIAWSEFLGLYCEVGVGGLIRTSPTAASGSWTVRISGTPNDLNYIIWDSFTSKFWVVGQAGTMLSSSDGITWVTVSLPGSVAADNFSSIATDGAGRFVVGNTSAGFRHLVSTNSGATFIPREIGGSLAAWSVHYDGQYFIVGRSNDGSNRFISYTTAGNINSGWLVSLIPGGSDFTFSVTSDGVNRIICGTGGFVATSPLSSSPAAPNWTVRTSGVALTLRVFHANGYLYMFGSSNTSLVSYDHGVTWVAGPAISTSSALRFGMSTRFRAMIIGDNGTLISGNYPASTVDDSIYITGINLDTNELKNIKLTSSTESYIISTSAYIQNT